MAPAAPSRRRPPPPAEGERNAIVGYLGQYELAAARTLTALREGTLAAVRVADVRAGQIDDFQLKSTDRVDAHQVKWSLHPGNVGYAEFTKDAEGRTRYIRQLADGWQRLRRVHEPLRVVVRFVTNDLPSRGSSPPIPRSDDIGQADGGVRTWSFAGFVAEAWRPAAEAARGGADPNTAVPVAWRPAFDAFAEASGLDAETWRRFVPDCELEFGAPNLETTVASALTTDAERHAFREDASRLAHAFMRLVARADRRVEFSRDQLLDELGWRFRTEFRNAHEFPDPEIPYRSIADTAREISDAIGRFTGGYLAVTGSPGSGKSTLLTRILRESPHRVVRYYAYVRDAVGGSLRRGEAVNFFHDLTVALDRAGLRSGTTLPVDDLDLLEHRVHEQLASAHAEWSEGTQRTLILVDGLDHIPREQHPTHSLLSHLPHPEDVPDGVLFILGTQTDRLQQISPRIREQLDEPDRRITMRALERRDVVDIIEAATDIAPAPTVAERERIFELSGGHPLALNYIVNRLRRTPGSAVAATLDAVEPFRDGIDRQYATLWGMVEDDVDLAQVLALLARARGPIRLGWMSAWAPRQAVHTLTTRLAYLFRQEHGGCWTFFHNSFRAFLIERTRELPALGGDRDLFTELAHHSSAPYAFDSEHADELYYRAQAGDTARVLALSDPDALRRQFVAGRSALTIGDDLELALDAAVTARDIVAMTRVLLCSAEFRQREHYAKVLPLAEAWLELGDIDLALGALREGASLRTSRKAALQAADALAERGFTTEGREVFTLAEPIDVLRGTGERTRHPREDMELLDAWIETAPRFRPIAVLLEMIERVRATDDDVFISQAQDRAAAAAAETEGRRCRLLQRLAMGLDLLERWDEADAVRAMLRAREGATAWWFWTQYHACNSARAGDQARARERFAALRDAYEHGDIPDRVLDPDALVAVAGGYVRLAHDLAAARRALEGVSQPAPATDGTYGHDEGWSPFQQRFALNRVLGALGDRRPIDEVVPEATQPTGGASDRESERTAIVARFERGVAYLGRLAGRAWVGDRPEPSEFELYARQVLAFFPRRSHDPLAGFPVLRARDHFYAHLVRVAAAHGREFVAILSRQFEAEWSGDATRDAWPDSLLRAVLKNLVSVGASREWARGWLARIEPMTFAAGDLETSLGEGVEQARAWAVAGDVVAARSSLQRVLEATFGNESKDDQLSPCLAWAVRANREDPARTPERLAVMAGAVVAIEGTEAQSYLARELLEAGVASGAGPARTLVEWALRNDVRGWVEALTILIDGLATRAPAAAAALSTCYRSLVLPFARAANVDVIAHLGTALREVQDARERERLGEAIEVVALGSTREALRQALAGRDSDARELLRHSSTIDPTAPGQVVDAFDGLSLTLRELQARTQNVADVQDLARRLRPGAYLHRWDLILEPLTARASADELAGTAAALPNGEHAWRALTAIADRLLRLGDMRAGEVIDRVVGASRAAGWWTRWDGGSRLAAYELLVRLSPESGRPAAWKALRDDLVAGEVSPMSVFHEWERITEMLAPEISAVQVWDVVSRHVAALVARAPNGEAVVLPDAEDSTDPSTAAAAVTALAAAKLDHPGVALAHGAQQYFVDRLLADDAAAELALAARLEDPCAPKEGALLVLRAVTRVRGTPAPALHDVLRGLRRAPSYPDRRAAVALIGPLDPEGEDGNSPTMLRRPLPAAFQIVHPPAPPLRRQPLPERGAILPPAEDAVDLVSIFRPELDLIARWAEVQPEALYRYVAERATAAVTPGTSEYAYDDELGLRQEMSRLGLEIVYRRPRARRVERAMAEATAMLIDHGWLGERYSAGLDRLFRNADPFFLLARPVRRPPLVAPIAERHGSHYVRDDWTESVSASTAVTGRTWIDGQVEATPQLRSPGDARAPGNTAGSSGAADSEWIVLVEETWLRWPDWKLATETRVGARLEPRIGALIDPAAEETLDPSDVDGEIAAGQALDAHVADFSHLLFDEYLTHARGSYSLVVRNVTYRFVDTPAGRWLAFNPALAEHFGWRLAPNGLFRWLDANGVVAAESIWWQDGFPQQRPPHFEDEVGHGWLVRVSASAWQQVASTVGPCVDWCRVARLAQEQPPRGVVGWEPVPDAHMEHDSPDNPGRE